MFVSVHRRRYRAPLMGAVIALVALAGCAGQRTPGGYGDSVQKNFVSSCQKTFAADAGETPATLSDGTELEPKEFCGCAYDKISDDVPFDDFKDVVNDQTETPGTLPESFTKAYESCLRPGSSTTTAGSSTTEQDSTSTTGG